MTTGFFDGEPTNLEAAALDALEWLKFWREYLNHNHLGQNWNEARRRMTLAIKALERFTPDQEPVFHSSPRPPLANIVVDTPFPFAAATPALVSKWKYVNGCGCELCAAASQEQIDKVCQLYTAFYESSRCVPYDPERNLLDYQAWTQAHMALSRVDQRKAQDVYYQVMQESIERVAELLGKIDEGFATDE